MSKTDKEVVRDFIKKDIGEYSEFPNVEQKKCILFPHLRPKFAGQSHDLSFDHFWRYGQNDIHYFERDGDGYWDRFLKGVGNFHIEQIGLRLGKEGWISGVYQNFVWVPYLLAALTAGSFSGIFPQSGVFSVMTLVVGFPFLLYRHQVVRRVKRWQQEVKQGRAKGKDTHQYWNDEIFEEWGDRLVTNMREDDDIGGYSIQEIQDAKEVIYAAVRLSDLPGVNLPREDRTPRPWEESPVLLARLRMIFIWQSDSLTKKYQKFLNYSDEEINNLRNQDKLVITRPIFETSEYDARRDIKIGTDRLPDSDNSNLNEILNEPHVWLDRKVSAGLGDKKTETTFSEAVTGYIQDWKEEDGGSVHPFTLSDRAASGKTTILNLLCCRSDAKSSDYWPLRIKLKKYEDLVPEESSEGNFLSQIKEEKKKDIPEGYDEDDWSQSLDFFFSEHPKRSPELPVPVIILDGLDEIPIGKGRKEWNEVIFQRHRIPIILSTRPSNFVNRRDPYSFEEMTISQRRRLLDLAHKGPENLEGPLDQVLERLPSTSNNPFMCLMIIRLLQKDSTPGNPDLNISLDSLSRSFIGGLIERESQKDLLLAPKAEQLAEEAPGQIGKKELGREFDKEIIENAHKCGLLDDKHRPLDPWLEGHYISRAIESEELKDHAKNKYLKPEEDLDDRDELILRQMISTNPSGIFEWHEFGTRASFAFSIIAEEWVARSSKNRDEYLRSFKLNWGIGDTDRPIEEAIIRQISDLGLQVASGLLHLHCSMFSYSREKLEGWRKTESDKTWEGLLRVVLEKIEIRFEQKLYSEFSKFLDNHAYENKREGRPFLTLPSLMWLGTESDFFRHKSDVSDRDSTGRNKAIQDVGGGNGQISHIVDGEFGFIEMDEGQAYFRTNRAYEGVEVGDYVNFTWTKYADRELPVASWIKKVKLTSMEMPERIGDFVARYLDSPYRPSSFRGSNSLLRKKNIEKIYRHIEYFRGQSNSGPPTGGHLLSWALSDNEWPNPQSGFGDGRRIVNNLGHSPMWIPIDKNYPKTKRLSEILSGESSALPICSLVTSVIESGKSIRSLAILLSTIEAIASEKVLRISKGKAMSLKEALIDSNENEVDIAQILILRLLTITTDENIRLFQKNQEVLSEGGMDSQSSQIVKIRIGRNEQNVRFFNQEGSEITEEIEIRPIREKLRFFDVYLNEFRQEDLAGEIEGSAVVVEGGTEFCKLSPILLKNDGSKEIRNRAEGLLPTKIKDPGFSIAQFDWQRFEGRLVAKSFLAHPDNRGFILTVEINPMSIIRRPRVGNPRTSCMTDSCDTRHSIGSCKCTRESNLFLFQSRRQGIRGSGSDRYSSTMATVLSNPAKSLIMDTPKPNIDLSEIVVSFNDDHSIKNHKVTQESLENLEGKCHVYLQYGSVRPWREEHHQLVIPGLEARELVFPMTDQDKAIPTKIEKGFSKWFGKDADIHDAKGRWYLCRFELGQTKRGYELIMPVPDSIELLCQRCLGVAISGPIDNGMEVHYICEKCHWSEEE